MKIRRRCRMPTGSVIFWKRAGFTNDRVDHSTREVVTWVMRFSRKGRVNQFDLYRNGDFVLTGGMKRCTAAITPKVSPILRDDYAPVDQLLGR